MAMFNSDVSLPEVNIDPARWALEDEVPVNIMVIFRVELFIYQRLIFDNEKKKTGEFCFEHMSNNGETSKSLL